MKKTFTNLFVPAALICVAGGVLTAATSGTPAPVTEEPLRIVGSLLSASGLTASEQGLYSFPVDNPGERTLILQGPVASYGGVVIDGIYYCNTHSSWFGMFNFYDVYGYDLTTGQEVMDYDGDDATAYFAQGGMNLDPVTGEAIGIFYDAEMDGRQLALVSYSDAGPTKHILAELSDPELSFNAFAVDGSGGCWAISMAGDLYSIDRQSGLCTLIGATGYTPYAVSGAVIDAATNKMYWALSAEDNTGRLIEVDLATGAGTQKHIFSDNAQWNGLYIPQKEAEPEAPGSCTDLRIDFPGGAMTGTLSFTTPATLYNGEPGSGDISVAAFVNGVEIARKSAAWGSEVSVDVDLEGRPAGQFDFMVYAYNEVGNGPRAKLKNVWVGTDYPANPSPILTYNDGVMTLKWDAVTEGANGGVINPENVEYTVYDKHNTLVVSGLTALSYQIPVSDTQTAKAYRYMVKASANGLDSETVKSNTVSLGSVDVPFEAEFSEEGIDAFTIIDGNNDGIEWSLYNESPIGVSIHYSEDYDMDDWFISPGLNLEAGKAYAVSFSTYSMESYYAERIEVKWGKGNTPEDMDQTILPPTLLPNMKTDPLLVTKYICPQETGRYFIGFHGISDRDKFDLILAEFSVAAPVSAYAPAKCTTLSAEADPSGLSQATISFRAPENCLAGSALSAPVSVEVYRNGNLIKTFTDLAPGSTQSFVDEPQESGQMTYRFLPSNAYGPGEPSELTAYVGFHTPLAPVRATISRTLNEGEVTVEWSEVRYDVDDLEFPAGSVVYDVYTADDEVEPVASGLTNLYYTFDAVDIGKQKMVSCLVYARYGDLVSEPATTTSIPVGTPYDGLWETGPFGNYIWGLTSAGGAAWSVLDDTSDGFPPSYDNDGTYFGCSGSEADDFGILFSGLVSLENLTDPSLEFATYHIPGSNGTIDQNKIMVSVKPEDAEEWIDLWERGVDEIAPVAGEWGKATIPLAEYAGQILQVQFMATCVSYPLTLIDGIHIHSGKGQNLAIAGVQVPSRAATGKDFQVKVDVENIGGRMSEEFEIRLYADGELMDTHGSADIEPGQLITEEFTLHMSGIAEEPMAVYAEVVYDLDEDLADNLSRVLLVEPKSNSLPAPRTLKVERDKESAVLSWDAPANGTAGMSVTEDFEDAESFCDSFGDWTFLDLDKSPVGGLTNTNIPGVVSGETLGSFWVWDADRLPIGGNGVPHSGSHYLFSLFRYDNKQSDEWAISPELNGETQTISFWAKSYSTRYPEHLQVLVSPNGTDPEDFTLLEDGDIAVVPGDWTYYEMEIPAGTKYFALRNYAAGAFMLMIDDVTYIPAAGTDLELLGYNIYRNGELISSVPVTSRSWSDSGLDKKVDYTYQVTALYEGDEESGSSNKVVAKGDDTGVNSASADDLKISAENGWIIIENPCGVEVKVYNTSGMTVFSGHQAGTIRIAATSGIYLISAEGRIQKLLVRNM